MGRFAELRICLAVVTGDPPNVAVKLDVVAAFMRVS
jgi:hypothetical protein